MVVKGEQKLWNILNDKLETLRASNRLPEAIRVAESALDLAKRAFIDDPVSLAVSYDKLGQLLDQAGNLWPNGGSKMGESVNVAACFGESQSQPVARFAPLGIMTVPWTRQNVA